jgi:hypothetical protein
MADNLIFVSCGQLTNVEKDLGQKIKSTIDATPGFVSYFAQNVQELESLGRHVFDAIRRCAGAVVVMHARGMVSGESVTPSRRCSVWINQELAIFAYRQFAEGRRLPVLCFADTAVSLEGAMTALIVNARPIGSSDEVITAVRAWLQGESFRGVSDAAFQDKWGALDENARMVISAIVEEGGHEVVAAAVASGMRRLFGNACPDTGNLMIEAELAFQNTGLVRTARTDYGKEFSLQNTWEFAVRRAVAKWLSGRSRDFV